jgi:hypothetical protein
MPAGSRADGAAGREKGGSHPYRCRQTTTGESGRRGTKAAEKLAEREGFGLLLRGNWQTHRLEGLEIASIGYSSNSMKTND